MLTAAKVRNVVRPGVYTDGPGRYGLTLTVQESAHGGVRKVWTQRLTVAGKRTMVGLGKVEFYTLAEARQMAFENARAAARGEPLVHGGARRRGARAVRTVPTFGEAADSYIGIQRAGWKAGSRNESNWRSSLAHAAPIAALRVDAIQTDDVAAIVAGLIGAGKAPTARAVRQRIRVIFDWCIAQGHRSENPGNGTLDALFPKTAHRVVHRESVPHADVPAVVAKIRALDNPTWRGMVAATEFAILTGARSAEVTGARWSEIDVDAATWTVPVERMKGNREHRVPLSGRALEILRAQADRHGTNGLIFRAPRGGQIDRLIPVLRAVGCDAEIHGFRSSLRDWCSETGVDDTVAERCLAHYETDSTRKAYHRTDRFEARVAVMADWAAHVRGD